MSTDAPSPTGSKPPLTAFQSFVLSLGSSSMVHLGQIPDPETRAPRVNLNLARATIETIELLGEKTQGNLTPAEEKTVQGLLTELRMRYVTAKSNHS